MTRTRFEGDDGKPPDEFTARRAPRVRGWLGARVEQGSGGALVTEVVPGSPGGEGVPAEGGI